MRGRVGRDAGIAVELRPLEPQPVADELTAGRFTDDRGLSRRGRR